MLITVLFFQEAIKVSAIFVFNAIPLAYSEMRTFECSEVFLIYEFQGLVSEFSVPKGENPMAEEYQFQWLYTNGLLAIIFSFGLLLTAIKSRRARSWPYGTGEI